jgi:hypothetical protein
MKNSPHAQVMARNIDQPESEGSTSALEFLEQPATLENGIKLGGQNLNLRLAPIRADWILEGNPVARNTVLSRSEDGMASTLIWDCTAGRFNWHYDIDETLYVLEGSVVIKDPTGNSRCLRTGEIIFFPAGSRAEWNIESYIRKIAFCRVPLSGKIQLARRVYLRLRRAFASLR